MVRKVYQYDTLERSESENGPRHEFANLAKTEVDRLDKLVGEFLRFARPTTLTVNANNINEIMGSVVSLVENQALSQGVSLKTDLADDLPDIMIDREQIKQVILNLAIKSLQAMPAGGTLRFRSFC